MRVPSTFVSVVAATKEDEIATAGRLFSTAEEEEAEAAGRRGRDTGTKVVPSAEPGGGGSCNRVLAVATFGAGGTRKGTESRAREVSTHKQCCGPREKG